MARRLGRLPASGGRVKALSGRLSAGGPYAFPHEESLARGPRSWLTPGRAAYLPGRFGGELVAAQGRVRMGGTPLGRGRVIARALRYPHYAS